MIDESQALNHASPFYLGPALRTAKIIFESRLTGVVARENDARVERATPNMAVSAHEAYEAGFSAGSQKPTISFEAGWTAFNVDGKANLPITLRDEFKRGYSSAIGFKMDSY